MSRIGNKLIKIPAGVTVSVSGSQVEVKGQKGALTSPLFEGITCKVEDGGVSISRENEMKQTKAWHGLVRSMINNNVVGVSKGYRITLKMIGTGYRVQAKGAELSISVGYSHPVIVKPTKGVTFALEGNDTIHVDGIDKQAVGQQAADIRKIRPPEPYLGKGIRYADEVVRRKQGKAAA